MKCLCGTAVSVGVATVFSLLLHSFETILNLVAVQRKRVFVERVLSYWVQKRQSRNNVPLIRRLQANPQPPKSKQTVSEHACFLPTWRCP